MLQVTRSNRLARILFPESSRLGAAVKWMCEIGLPNTRKMVSSYGRLHIDIDLGLRSTAAPALLLSDRGSPFAQEMCWKNSLNIGELRVLQQLLFRSG